MKLFLLLFFAVLPFSFVRAESFLFIDQQECAELPSNAMLLLSRNNKHAESYSLSFARQETGMCLFATNLNVPSKEQELVVVILVENAAGEMIMRSPRKLSLVDHNSDFLSLEELEKLAATEQEHNTTLSKEVLSLSRRVDSLKKDALLIGSYAKLEQMQKLISRREDHVKSLDSILTNYHAVLTKEVETQANALQKHQINQLQKMLLSLESKYRGDKSVVQNEETGYLDEVAQLKKQIAELRIKRKELERKLGY